MQDFCLVLALIGVIVVPVLLAAFMGRKPKTAEQPVASPALPQVPINIAYARKKAPAGVAILPVKG